MLRTPACCGAHVRPAALLDGLSTETLTAATPSGAGCVARIRQRHGVVAASDPVPDAAGAVTRLRSRSLAAVDALTQQVGMTCMAGVFLDHVHVNPAQADLLADAGMEECLVKIVTRGGYAA